MTLLLQYLANVENAAAISDVVMKDQSLTQVPPEVKNCASLDTLVLSHNTLTELDLGWDSAVSGCATTLRHLEVSQNQLQRVILIRDGVPGGGGRLLKYLSLSTLDLSNNNLSHLSLYLADAAPLLSFLDVSHNNLRDLSFAFQCSKLESFAASHNDVRSALVLRWDHSFCRSLATLDVSSNAIPIVDFVGSGSEPLLPALTELDVSANHLTGFTDTFFFHIPDLQILYGTQNNLERLPASMGSCCPSLRVMDFSENRIFELPVSLEGHEGLREVSLVGNCLGSKRPECVAESTEAPGHSVSEKDVSLLILRVMGSWSGLTTLDVFHNFLYSPSTPEFDGVDVLPPPDRPPGLLQDVNLSYNVLETIPSFVASRGHQSLRSLDVSHNRMASLPRGRWVELFAGASYTLETLILSHNRLEIFCGASQPEVMQAFQGLETLTELDLEYNALIAVPAQFPPSLVRLLLANNHMATTEVEALERRLVEGEEGFLPRLHARRDDTDADQYGDMSPQYSLLPQRPAPQGGGTIARSGKKPSKRWEALQRIRAELQQGMAHLEAACASIEDNSVIQDSLTRQSTGARTVSLPYNTFGKKS